MSNKKRVTNRVPVRALRTQAKTKGSGKVLSVETARQLERRYKVMAMRKDGYPIHEIANTLNCTPETVRRDVQEVLGMLAHDMIESTEERRLIELERYEAILRRHQPLAEAGNLASASLVLQVSREIRKLMAVDKPEEKKAEETAIRVYVGVDIDAV